MASFQSLLLSVLSIANVIKTQDPSRFRRVPLYNLKANLLNGYDITTRPVYDYFSIVHVEVDLSLSQVLDIDDEADTLLISGWLNYKWTDQFLQWNKSDYDNISLVRMPSEYVWRPDLFLYNSADSSSWNQWDVSNLLINVNHNGTVQCTPTAIIKVACETDVSSFPFDEKHCQLKFGSWMYQSSAINLSSNPNIYMDKYIKNGIWYLFDNSQEVVYDSSLGRPGNYSVLNVNLHFRRRHLFYFFNYIMPGMFVSLMSISGFFLPPTSGEKIGLQITNLLAVVFFVQYVSTIVPPSSNGIARVSLQALYLTSVTLLCMFSLLGNVFVLDLNGRDVRFEKDMPKWFHNLCLKLAAVMRMKRFKIVPEDSNTQKPPVAEFFAKHAPPRHVLESDKRLDKMEALFKRFLERENDRASSVEKELKFKYAAIVMDRFFFYLSLLYSVVTFIALVLTMPLFSDTD